MRLPVVLACLFVPVLAAAQSGPPSLLPGERAAVVTAIPGVIAADAVIGDLYDLVQGQTTRRCSDSEITLYKNGGGAHMDLMIARYISEKVV